MVRANQVKAARLISLSTFLLCSGTAFAQSAEKESAAVLEVGGAAGWNVRDWGRSFGPTVAVEVTPVENWLEIEGGVTRSFGAHSAEWDTDLLFKKPWTLSEKAEFMFGAGPAWVHSRESGVTANSFAAEVALDFMFWPAKKHRFGWYLEPGYEYGFGRGRERSIGISGGLLIAIP